MLQKPKINNKRYEVAFFNTEDGVIRIPKPVANYIETLEDAITDRNTQLQKLITVYESLVNRNILQRIFNKVIR